ncbi:tRNA1(Val) (adenine(37)-N6)-methyltransferase [Dysgonomonas sp. BGC7]|uniref:tRNA1(Val) (adenine(37)-N6)-methyltransferase n=1 Tax=Dysgonomonas sp. BGC7 TaxID=1658008 RepID=UPI000680766B|nr:methyltransferase [Dysgonomonas sp. BGC7]MBD8389730.1 methyltransferase [Dysgonomonas sp. BGC7]
MPNPFFHFKQFTVYHDRCAMKVGTDGVLLGAWTDISDAKTALDIGTGTGLISLMIAQRNSNITIDAIDIEIDAIAQAKDNIKNSPFATQIKCTQCSVQEFAEKYEKKYDIIVSNPPFFAESLKSPDNQRSLARHDDTLSINDLLKASAKLLNNNGKLSLIYPYEYKRAILDIAKLNNLFINKATNVYPTSSSQPKRILLEISKNQTSIQENSLTIEESRHIYSDEFTELVKDFYLKL